jgi:hypothetical protein|tara:strand:+ start:742 stop:942 length:201 start_codon:yes stop_codon:yes gene_type:complete
MEEDIPYIQMDLDVEDVRILYSAVNKHLEVWAGGNSEDQANLVRMKYFLFRVLTEFSYDGNPYHGD